jgi:hypothetical protein
MNTYSDTQISDAWNVLFQASEELKNLIRRQPAQVIDFKKFKERRMAQPNLHEERKA